MPGDVLCFSHLRWGFVYQRPNHLMSRCAKKRRVFFVEEPHFDGEGEPRFVVRPSPESVTVVVPYLPERCRPKAASALQGLVDDLLVKETVRDPLLWFYTPMALAFAGHLRGSATVYDCMDELALFRGAPAELLDFERDLFARADLVFTGGQSLYEAKRARHPRVYAFPSSVDAAHFAKARGAVVPVPGDMAAIPPLRIGYFGVIDERIDLHLLERLADHNPAWQVVMVGPVVKINEGDLPRRPNLHYLGAKNYDELPTYLAAWDVAVMPFALNEATRFISPTKTLEYLAAGKPVVSTPIRDVVRPYGDEHLVRVGSGDGFVTAVAEALAERGTTAALQRQRAADAFVAKTSWDRTWTRMDSMIGEASDRRRADGKAKQVSACSTT